MPGRIAIVLIGRNEGTRLRAALASIPFADADAVVYVDSASQDDSVEAARRSGADVVELDAAQPLSAARARNAGFARAVEQAPAVDRVQFVDGDCALEPGWLARASAALDADPGAVAVCGWRRERFPERTPWNRLCDLEWQSGGVGPIDEFGGDVMIRRDAFEAAGGYDPARIAGEDPDLSHRLRARGGRLLRLDTTMTHHDADLRRAGQWWRRMVRAGHAYAENARAHPSGGFARPVRRALAWSLLPPLAVAAGAWLVGPVALLGLAAYPAQALRIARRAPTRFSAAERRLWGAGCVASQLPLAVGVVRHEAGRRLGRRSSLIEYKGTSA